MKKNVWSMDSNDIAILSNGKRYRHKRDFKQRRPRLGVTQIRELVNVEDPSDTQRFIFGILVEIEQAQGEGEGEGEKPAYY